MAKQIIVSKEGLKKLQQELEHLKTVKRKEVALAIQKARAYGDLSENSEYDEAKNEQAKIEARIVEIEAILKNIEVIEEVKGRGKPKTVSLGVLVKALDIEFDEECEYRVVGSLDADPANGKISDDSPLGKALLGKKIGDEVIVDAPAGELKFKILEISK